MFVDYHLILMIIAFAAFPVFLTWTKSPNAYISAMVWNLVLIDVLNFNVAGLLPSALKSDIKNIIILRTMIKIVTFVISVSKTTSAYLA